MMRSLFNTVELMNTQELAIGEAQMVSINYISEAITIYESEGDTLVLKEYFNDSDPDLFADITIENGSIVIRHGDRPVLFNTLRGYIEVYLPKRYYGGLNVKSVSGKIVADRKLVLSEIAVSNTSGRIELGDVTAGTAVISSVSGGIYIDSLRAIANVRSTSGSIRIEGVSGSGEYKNVSGSIDLTYQAVTGDITASSTSGRIHLGIPHDLSFHIKAQSVSGRIDAPVSSFATPGKHTVAGTVGNAPQAMLDLKTVSGRIEVAQT